MASLRRPQGALNPQRMAPYGRAWWGGYLTSHGPSLRATRGRSRGGRKPGPSPLPALASWKGTIRRKKEPRGEEVAAPRRVGRQAGVPMWPTLPWANPAQLLPSPLECICVMLPGAESWRLSRACASHTPKGYFTTEKPHALLGKPVLCAHNGNLDQGDDTPRSSSQISREGTGPA